MTVELDGTTVTTTMRTPGNDFELAVGFCHTEGLLGGAAVDGVRYCATGPAVESEFNIVSVDTGGLAPEPTPRLGVTSSSCGWCGSEQLDEMYARLAPLPETEPMSVELLGSIPDLVSNDQGLFATTGAVHAAAAFDRDGAILRVREDVGRHNAVDKVVGRMLYDGIDDAAILSVSGRVSFEIVQKAAAADVPIVTAVSAPTSLAIDLADRAGITLAAFVRDGRANVYTHPARIG